MRHIHPDSFVQPSATNGGAFVLSKWFTRYTRSMKILCWNVNGLRAVHKKDLFGQIFKDSPDVVSLQEIKALPEQLPEEIRNPKGYHSYFNAPDLKKGYSG